METKEFKIIPPEGYEIDKENSTLDCIKFKPIVTIIDYVDVADKLFNGKTAYYPGNRGEVLAFESIGSTHPNNCVSKKQVEKLMAINKLINVAKYLNCDWIPDWNNCLEAKYYLHIDNNIVSTNVSFYVNVTMIYFKTEKLAKQAIKILGEDVIRLAFSTDY